MGMWFCEHVRSRGSTFYFGTLFCESVTNPEGSIADLSVVADSAHEAGVPVIVESTLATPYLCETLDHGAHV